METMTCPNCHATIAMTVLAPAPAPARGQYAIVESDEVQAVRSFCAGLSGRLRFTELRTMYGERSPEAGWPALSDKALARGLRAAGWTSWRTKDGRGWEL